MATVKQDFENFKLNAITFSKMMNHFLSYERRAITINATDLKRVLSSEIYYKNRKPKTYEYEKAMHFDPISPVVLNRLASSKNALGEYEESEQVLTPLLEFYPEYFDTYLNLGLIYLNKSNLVKAEEALNNAISINPFDPQVHIDLISVYEIQGLSDLVEKERDVLRTILGEVSKDE